MKYKDQVVQKFLDDLAAKRPSPGGGSVAALTAALAAGLLSMVANYTIGKDPKKDENIKDLLNQSEHLRKEFLDLMDRDVEAYASVSSSRKQGEEQYQLALRNATEVPLKVCIYCEEGLKLSESFFPDANKNLLSDLDIANILFKSALSAALINVKINLPLIKDKGFIKNIEQRITKF